MYKKIGEGWTCSSGDMLADKQTDTLITILRSPPTGGGVTMSSVMTDTERTITTSMRLPLTCTLRYANKNTSCVFTSAAQQRAAYV